MNKHSIRYAAIVVALFAALFASAAPKVDVQPGTAMYLVVLRDSAKAPDLTALGGRVLESSMNRRVVLLPESRAEELRSHAAVAYMQRIWGGEPLGDSPRPAPRSASSVVSNATLYEDWASGEYRYDGSGNIKKIGSDAYGYDRVSRITGASIPNRNVSETYAYDPFGNLERLGAKTFAVQHGTNRLEPPLLTYDGGGFVTGDTTAPNRPRTYHYDALGMMTAIDDVSEDRRMIYTADDERIVLSVGENTSYRIRDFGGKVLREWKSAAGVLAWDRDWIYGDGQLLAGAVQVDTRLDPARHYHADHLGSIRMVTDGAGTTITRNDFAPFGRELTSTSQEYDNTAHVRDPLKFTAHERDYFSPANVNDDDYIDDMHARYYGPGVGRFLAVDPTWESSDMARPQTWNRYSYVLNNPVGSMDPDGRLDEQPYKEFPRQYAAARKRLAASPGSVEQDRLFVRAMGKVILAAAASTFTSGRVLLGTLLVGSGVGGAKASKAPDATPTSIVTGAADGAATAVIVRGGKNVLDKAGVLPADRNARDDAVSGLAGVIGGVIGGNAISDFVKFDPNSMPHGPKPGPDENVDLPAVFAPPRTKPVPTHKATTSKGDRPCVSKSIC